MFFKKVRVQDYPIVLIALKKYKNKDYKSAQAYLSKVIDKNSSSAYLNFKYGMCFYKQGLWADAVKYFKLAKHIGPFQKVWEVQLNMAIKHVGTSEKNLALTKRDYETNLDNANVVYAYAKDLYDTKNYWLAIHVIENYLEVNESSQILLSHLAFCYEKLTNYHKAVEAVERLLQMNDKNLKNMYRYVFYLSKCGEHEKANEFHERLLSSGDDRVNEYGIGIFHAERGLWNEAASAYELTVAAHGEHASKSLLIECAKAFSYMQRWDKAAHFYEKIIRCFAHAEAKFYYKCGESHEKNGNNKQAIHYYSEAVLRSNDYRDYWYYRLGHVLSNEGRNEEASQVFIASRKNTLAHGVSPSDVIKNENQAKLSFYVDYYETLPIKNNFVLFESFLANSFGCNPYALLKSMLNNPKFKLFRFIVVLNGVRPIGIDDDRVIIIKRNSDAYLRYLASAKYLINNVTFPYFFIRRPEQVYLNTWHGTPLKTLGRDIKYPMIDYGNVARNFLQCTHLISQNRYTNDILLERYNIKDLFTGRVAETGYPRVDLTLNLAIERKAEILEILGLKGDKPIVFYAPTWRGTSTNRKADINKIVDDLTYLQSSKFDLVFRAHHFADEAIRDANVNVKLVPGDIDTNELLACVDMLISDYSSIVFDFLRKNKPIFSYVYDFEEYEAARGLYVKVSELPGIVCHTIDDLKDKILVNLNTSVNHDTLIHTFASHDDGKSSQKTIDFLFNNDLSHVYHYERKEVDLFFCGPYIPNGISRSFDNLMSNLLAADLGSEYTISVVLNRTDVVAHSKRVDEFERNYKNAIAYQVRVGEMNLSIEERLIRNKVESVNQFYSERTRKIYLSMFKREVRRLFGDSHFRSVINFDGYSLFWVALFSQINAHKHIIYQHNDFYQEWKTRFPYLQAVFNLYNEFDTVLSVSEMTMENNKKNLAELFGIPDSKFAYTNNTILPEVIIENAHNIEELDKRFVTTSGKKILTIGRLSHEKDHEKLIHAFKASIANQVKAKLFIIGSGPLEDHLDQLVKNLGLQDDIVFLGQQTNPYSYLKNADLFVLSSNHEGQPMVLLEALTLEKPIIATDIVGNRGVLKDKYGYLVENSVEGLRLGLNGFLNGEIIFKHNFDAQAYNKKALDKFLQIIH